MIPFLILKIVVVIMRVKTQKWVTEALQNKNKEQQDHFNMRGNLPPPRASHRSGLCQPRHVNYTHTTLNHTNSSSRTRSTSVNHSNKNSKRRSTPNPKCEYVDNVVINNSNNETRSFKQQTNKHKSHKQVNPYYDHNSSHDKKIKPFLDAIALFNKEISEITYFINHVVLTQYGIHKGLQVFSVRRLEAIKK